MGPSLRKLIENHSGKETDKWSLYLDEWDRLFSPIRNAPIGLLEIGIQNGGSLEVWSKYFANAKIIVGCDIDDKCGFLQFEDPRVNIVIGDANSGSTLDILKDYASTFDVIIDDGSHISSDIIQSFVNYFPMLDYGGIYLIEDLHASYWEDFGGGLYYPYSAISFFKRLIDVINYEHWRNSIPQTAILRGILEKFNIKENPSIFSEIHSIKFINSLCIIRKDAPKNNVLGPRIIRGLLANVTEPHQSLNGTLIQDMDVRVRNDSSLDIFSLIDEVGELKTRLSVVEPANFKLNNLALNLQDELNHKNELIESLIIEENRQKSQIAKLMGEVDSLSYLKGNILNENEKLENEIAVLKSVLSTTQAEAKHLEAEVIHYTSSKSWKFTRPFRKINGLIRRLIR